MTIIRSFSSAILVLASFLLCSCSSTTTIQSIPSGAKLYLDGQFKGTTPFDMTDTKIVGSSTQVRLELPGYITTNATIVRNERADVGAIIGGIFFLFPFLWVMEYDQVHTYELRRGDSSEPPPDHPATAPAISKDKLERLRDLRKLYDDGTLTKDEFDREKQKILDEK